MRLEDRLFSLISSHPGGGDSAPGDWLRHRIRTYEEEDEYITAYITEDGWSFWIGSKHEWWGSLSRFEARSLAWFILWTWWAKAEWFGLRRWLWIKLLHRRVERHKRMMERTRGA